MMRLFKIITGEVDWICARDEAEARAHFAKSYDSMAEGTDHASELDGATVTEIERERWAGLIVKDDDIPGGRTTAAAIIGNPEQERDAFLVASTCY